MTIAAHSIELGPAPLDAEWRRMGHLLALAEASRAGRALDETFSKQFETVNSAVDAARKAGAWSCLMRTGVSQEALQDLLRIDLDILAAALAPVAQPAQAPRIHSLQPHIGNAWVSLPLLQELMMLESGADIALMAARISAGAPLVATGLLRAEGNTPYQVLRPSARLISACLGRDAELAPPPGAILSTQRGAWEELILPDTAIAQLKDFTAWAARSQEISDDWGGKPVHGPLALFSGASGTGKTFAAGCIAAALQTRTDEPWALYTLDLGRVMSKYVGETEANLNALLESLDGRRAVLQIDEADGLLGKRGDVSDARDRYANLEVSHLLSRFERHIGPVILTTNLRANVDSAFLRRFQLIVDFPAPDAKAREKLWGLLLPPKAPRAKGLDLRQLGADVRLSGGAIQNAAHYAAVLAAEAETPIGPPQIARAVKAELSKDGRQIRKSELGHLADFLAEAQS
ncbi:ATP-binding protein [Shimia sp. R10_1]|uniref:ATP-binding protein n=1 Tax=Shimia sp. R10_1 TaxID=2821095 RepID=UPI001ADB83BF|nr:ATP-binding protein [Shimia sp. R10_1]MBO9474738.1 ATP-binding protein [Shimia sp. R10_1]